MTEHLPDTARTAGADAPPASSYYERHIFFCLNERKGGEACCAHLGAQAGFDRCKSQVKAAGLAGHATRATSFPHFYLALEAALAGGGALVCPRRTLTDQFQRGDLIEPWPQIRVQGPTFHVIWQRNSSLQKDVAIFVQWLAEMAEHEAGGGA